VPCINTKNGDNILYFSNVIDEYVKTLDRHNKETIIIHTKKKKKKKSISKATADVGELIVNSTSNHIKYGKYFSFVVIFQRLMRKEENCII